MKGVATLAGRSNGDKHLYIVRTFDSKEETYRKASMTRTTLQNSGSGRVWHMIHGISGKPIGEGVSAFLMRSKGRDQIMQVYVAQGTGLPKAAWAARRTPGSVLFAAAS
jgi:hypothetical protein